MRRVLAVLVAVGLVGGALLVRSRLDAGEQHRREEADRPRGTLVCVPEARAVCEAVAADRPEVRVRVEDAATTAAALGAASFAPASADIDAWVAPQPVMAGVDDTRTRSGLDAALGTPTGVLARSPLVTAVWNDRLAALRSGCPGGAVDWACIGAASGEPWVQHGGQELWGVVKPGFPDASRDGTGLLTLGQGTGEVLGRTDYASNDLDDPAVRSWMEQLKRGVPTFTPPAGSALAQMLFAGRSSFDLAASVEALAGPAVQASRDKNNITILYPAPVATMDMAAVPIAGRPNAPTLVQAVADGAALDTWAAKGWRVDGRGPADGIRADPLPASSGLPAPGVLAALRERWSEIR